MSSKLIASAVALSILRLFRALWAHFAACQQYLSFKGKWAGGDKWRRRSRWVIIPPLIHIHLPLRTVKGMEGEERVGKERSSNLHPLRGGGIKADGGRTLAEKPPQIPGTSVTARTVCFCFYLQLLAGLLFPTQPPTKPRRCSCTGLTRPPHCSLPHWEPAGHTWWGQNTNRRGPTAALDVMVNGSSKHASGRVSQESTPAALEPATFKPEVTLRKGGKCLSNDLRDSGRNPTEQRLRPSRSCAVTGTAIPKALLM